LAVILAEASLALEEPAEGDVRTAMRVIFEQANTMNEIISALLVLARTEATEHLQDVVDVDTMVQRAVMATVPVAQARHVEVSVDAPPDITIPGSELLLIRVLRNLLDNAIKVSSPGSTVRV